MLYLLIFFAVFCSIIMYDFIMDYKKFRESHSKKYSFVLNAIKAGTKKVQIDRHADEFMRDIIQHCTMYYQDYEYYITDGNVHFKLTLVHNIVILYHIELSSNVINSKFISVETIKMIKDAQNKLTTHEGND